MSILVTQEKQDKVPHTFNGMNSQEAVKHGQESTIIFHNLYSSI
jgi:hypothetical protein